MGGTALGPRKEDTSKQETKARIAKRISGRSALPDKFWVA